MIFETPSIEQLSTVISQVAGPAFLLAAEAQLLAVLISRIDRIVDRSRFLAALDDEDRQACLKVELSVLRRRAALVHRAIYWGLGSCIVTCFLVILSFASTLLHMRHEYGAGLLFIFAMALFTAALIAFWREVKVGYSELEFSVTPPQTRDGATPSPRGAGRGLG